jgi:predicted nucleotidyltransferase
MLPEFYKKFDKGISWINTNTNYLVLHGSRAYGTNTPESDYDYKGFCIPPKEYYLGFNKKFEQAELKEPDTVIYELNKFVSLAIQGNPNIFEVLFVDEQDIIYIDEIGEEIRNARNSFLSMKVRHTFGGYAYQNLKKMKNHHDWMNMKDVEEPTRESMGLPVAPIIPKAQIDAISATISKEMDKFQMHLDEVCESDKIEIQNVMSKMLAELKITSEDRWLAAARKIGLTDNYIEIMQKENAYNAKKANWNSYNSWKKTRNPERFKDELKFGYDGKNAYQLIRLTRMCREMLTTGKVHVKRPDREELLFIRNGGWTYEQIIEYSEEENEAMQELYLNCKVFPKVPNIVAIDSLCVKLVESFLNRK